MADKYYAVFGRVAGDDENTCHLFGPVPDTSDPHDMFREAVIKDLGGDGRLVMAKAAHGEDIYITTVLSADTPITSE